MVNGFDCATKLTTASAKTLKDLGFQYVARYLGTNWKAFDATEAKVIQQAGLNLISVFEKNSTSPGYFTKEQGIADAKEAMGYAKAVGQPVGSAIYFTVDYDAQNDHMDAIGNYLDGVKQTLQDYKVGLYGNYNVVMGQKGKVDYYWQTYAWSAGKVADHIHIHQYQNNVTVAGIAIDRNDIKDGPGHWVVEAPKKEAPKQAVAMKETNDDYLYIVKNGDTLSKIAADKGVTVDYLVNLNNIPHPDKIYPGQRLKLKGNVPPSKPAPKPDYHTVIKGQTVSNIALIHGTTTAAIDKLNPKIENLNLIYPGQKIRVK